MGFGAPIGNPSNLSVPLETLQDDELQVLGVEIDRPLHLQYEGGISVKGLTLEIVRGDNGNLLYLNVADAIVQYEGKVIWSTPLYTLAIGIRVVSVFAGPADVEAFEPTAAVPREKMHKVVHDESSLRLQKLYSEVRKMRETTPSPERLKEIFQNVTVGFKKDWLLTLEILELLEGHGFDRTLQQETRAYLEAKASGEPALEQLIRNGLALLEGKAKAPILHR
jgi:phenylalanine-4-hydroxylase